MTIVYIDNKYYDMGEGYHHAHSSPCYTERLEAMYTASKEDDLIIFTDEAMKIFLDQMSSEEKPSIAQVEVLPPTSFSIYGGGFHMWESHLYPYWHVNKVRACCAARPLTEVCSKLNKDMTPIAHLKE